jgi:hypothetical protein
MDRSYVRILLVALATLLLDACYHAGNKAGEDGEEDDACAEGLVLCGGVCVDTATDSDNCGACGLSCDSGQICVSGTCRPGCVDECVEEGNVRCALYPPDYVEACRDGDGDGCLEWSDLSPCPEGTTCTDGVCSEECPVICEEAGERRCTDDARGYETCGDFDGDGCLEWGDAVACDGQDICADGECRFAGPPCGDDRCEDGESCDSCPVDCGYCPVVCEEAGWEWDLGPDFSVTENPAGAWSYGWTNRIDGAGFTAGTPYDLGPMKGWVGSMTTGEGPFPAIMQNRIMVPADFGGAHYDPGEVGMVPALFGARAVARWTSPFAGSCDVEAHFYAKSTGIADLSIVQDADFLEWIDMSAGEIYYNNILDVGPGSTIQLTVGGFAGGSLFDYAAGADIRMRKRTWILANDFVAGCNPIGQWEFGYASSTEPFARYGQQGFREIVNPFWSRSGPVAADGLQSYVWKNSSSEAVDSVDPGGFALHPGCFDDESRCGEEWAVVRWTSPFEGQISVMGTFGEGGPGAPDLAIIQTSGSLSTPLWFRENVPRSEVFDLIPIVREGDTINAVVGDAFEGGDTPLDIEISVIGFET